jgi:hypothetical protein
MSGVGPWPTSMISVAMSDFGGRADAISAGHSCDIGTARRVC